MEFQKNEVTKLCSFYVSDWHLVTMLLPYLHKQIEGKTKIATVLEKDLKENVDTLLERINIKTTNQIKEINWTRTNERKYTNIKRIMEEVYGDKQLIIINGSKEFIQTANENIEKYIQKNQEKLQKSQIKIVNCYEIVEFNGSITEILDAHDKLLNTSGEKEIQEIFEDYERKEKIG